MCYVKTAPALSAASVVRQQQQNSASIEEKLAFHEQKQQQQQQNLLASSFSFPDLASFDSFADNQWLNLDSDSILQSALSTAACDTSLDFMPWLDSFSMDTAFDSAAAFDSSAAATTTDSSITTPTADELLLFGAHPTISAESSLPNTPFHGIANNMIKSEPIATVNTSSAYLPSPAESQSEKSAFPSLCQQSIVSGPMVVAAQNGGAPVSPPPSSGSSGDESSSNETSRKAPRKRAAPASRKSSSGSSGSSRKRLASNGDDEDDEEGDDRNKDASLKRMKNTEAARRSRARKLQKLECLESEVEVLEKDKSNLLVRLAVLENEQASFAQREADLNSRINQLESQLAESHRAMILSLGRG
ncbi:hypothetical protein BC829DRAFT_400168 [Chytridium lagenaria]|nr:hypothetical protein BC829DRAFT_400168 [Chytridium lagenaria]